MELATTGTVLPGVAAGNRLLTRPAEALLTWMRPRDTRMAARTVSALCAVGLVVTVVTLPLGVNEGTELDGWAIALAGVSLLLAAMISAAAWYFDDASRLAWALCPFAAIMVIVLVDLATHDGSVSAQIFFVFPTVYGAALLPRPGAILVTCASLAGELVVVFTVLPVREAAREQLLRRSGPRDRRGDADPQHGTSARAGRGAGPPGHDRPADRPGHPA